MIRKIRRAIRRWLECRTKRCDYYRHYLAYGPAELTHIGYHSAERLAELHFANCKWDSEDKLCPACSWWEKAIRA